MPCSCALEVYHARMVRHRWDLLSTAPGSCAQVPRSAHLLVRLTDGRCRVNHSRSRRTCQGCSPPATSEAARSNAAQRRSARGRWQLPWSTSASLKSAASEMGTQPTTDLSGDSSVQGPSEEARAEFSRLASGQQIRSLANALERSGITVSVVDSGEEARRVVRSLLPVVAGVYYKKTR